MRERSNADTGDWCSSVHRVSLRLMINEHLRSIREFEANAIVPWLPADGTLLEIGAGAGWQAQIFRQRGLRVFAIDVASSEYLVHSRFPTVRYDGSRIPFAEATFDIVYSSNVLEHIKDIEDFHYEMLRVLKRDGIMIHVLPTASWRLSTSAAHYAYLAKAIIRRLTAGSVDKQGAVSSRRRPRLRHWLSAVRSVLPRRHGEFGNWFTEVYYFSRFRWLRLFRRLGLTLHAYTRLGLCYTGYSVFDARLPLRTRAHLGRLFGSAGQVFVLRRGC